MTEIKYRYLTNEELEYFRKEFIEFLVVNGIAAEDWQRIKEGEPEKAEDIVVIFSNMILEGTLLKTNYLEYISKNKIASIHFQNEQMVLVAMEAPHGSSTDFTDPIFIKQATKAPPSFLDIYTKSFPYLNPREKTIWDYTQNGWYVSDGKLYKALCMGL